MDILNIILYVPSSITTKEELEFYRHYGLEYVESTINPFNLDLYLELTSDSMEKLGNYDELQISFASFNEFREFVEKSCYGLEFRYENSEILVWVKE